MTNIFAATNSDFEPVFIVGHPRSGTTLLSVLLDRNTNIAVTPETHFANQLAHMLPKYLDLGAEETVDFLLQKTRIMDLNLDRDRLLARMNQQPLDVPSVFRCVLQEYAVENDKALVIEKSPTHLLCLPQIVSWYPRAKIIWIVRDGRDAVLSLLKVDWASSRVWELALQWVRNMKRVLEFEEKHPDSIYRIYYESLLREPQTELVKLHRFIGISFEPSQLDDLLPTTVVPAWEEGWKSKAKQKIDPRRIGAWREHAHRSQLSVMNALMGRYLRRLGYPETSASQFGAGTRVASVLSDAFTAVFFSRQLYGLTSRMWLSLQKLGAVKRKLVGR